ncbi:Holliday junction branch migration protein RuvA [Marinihelvus fidelis]|uniref:Holliday junction branch migration complex subunit RuvA n=1 Tax=Marinihelvus fidelis TaxID=2613842 RepID=A0A5N0TES3_9GAMM|nr:Holliday junction branch migration protein RuvA [Marinihelvus fidelis]KAA9133500.1 Holliday junction branch migration protein RuvA [Marinihelvus fidelis]
MISRLSGTLLEVHPPSLVIDVAGVGYEVEVPNTVFDRLPGTGQPLVLLTHLQITQDHHTLFGFATAAERTLFRQLLKISGIGAKLALTILSGAPGDQLARYVSDRDTAALTKLPGIGKKTAERIIIELRDKLDAMPSAAGGEGGTAAAPDAVREASDALRSLGYKPAEVSRMVRDVAESGMNAEEIIRKALQKVAA